MAASKQLTRLGPSWPWWRRALTGLSALGLAFSAYLGWHYLMGGRVIGCSDGGGCDQVLASRWSVVAGVLPVSGLAVGTYLAMLLASFFVGPAMAASDRRLAWGAMLVLAGAAAGSAAWFIFIQVRFIGAFCPYCMATHAIGLLLAALIVGQAVCQPQSHDVDGAAPSPASFASSSPRLVRPLATISLAAMGVALAGVLAALQLGLAPSAVYRGGQSHENLATIDPHAAPLAGSPDARHVVTLLFDYECPHCQKVHSMLTDAIRRYDGRLAFVLCPTPLNSQCNPYVARDTTAFKDSCELARIALAVWVARREAFADFDHWMFSPEPGQRWRPRTPDTARAKAVELIGQAKFDAHRADPWIDQYLQKSVRVFGDTAQGTNAVPRLVFGTRWVTPEPRDTSDLVTILHDSLSVPRP